MQAACDEDVHGARLSSDNVYSVLDRRHNVDVFFGERWYEFLPSTLQLMLHFQVEKLVLRDGPSVEICRTTFIKDVRKYDIGKLYVPPL